MSAVEDALVFRLETLHRSATAPVGGIRILDGLPLSWGADSPW